MLVPVNSYKGGMQNTSCQSCWLDPSAWVWTIRNRVMACKRLVRLKNDASMALIDLWPLYSQLCTRQGLLGQVSLPLHVNASSIWIKYLQIHVSFHLIASRSGLQTTCFAIGQLARLHLNWASTDLTWNILYSICVFAVLQLVCLPKTIKHLCLICVSILMTSGTIMATIMPLDITTKPQNWAHHSRFKPRQPWAKGGKNPHLIKRCHVPSYPQIIRLPVHFLCTSFRMGHWSTLVHHGSPLYCPTNREETQDMRELVMLYFSVCWISNNPVSGCVKISRGSALLLIDEGCEIMPHTYED